MTLSVEERAERYDEAFPQFPGSHLRVDGGKLYGNWMGGQNYQNATRLYGAYPPSYLPRMQALFPDKERVLHLFSGSLPPGDYVRFDLMRDDQRDPDVQGDAHELSQLFSTGKFDLIYADPPYSTEDAKHYGTPMVKRKKVLEQCHDVLEPGGWVVWLDQVWPMFSKKLFTFRGFVSLVRSTNHRVRAAFFFERV